MSRPARARGLKLALEDGEFEIGAVAPRAGAWIETLPHRSQAMNAKVAPRAGAWIETGPFSTMIFWILSRPARARGLKRYLFFRF